MPNRDPDVIVLVHPWPKLPSEQWAGAYEVTFNRFEALPKRRYHDTEFQMLLRRYLVAYGDVQVSMSLMAGSIPPSEKKDGPVLPAPVGTTS